MKRTTEQAHEEYNNICAMVANCPLAAVSLAWRYACENGIDTVDETTGRFMPSKRRWDLEVEHSIDSLPCALQTAYEHAISIGGREGQEAERALMWWRNRGYSY